MATSSTGIHIVFIVAGVVVILGPDNRAVVANLGTDWVENNSNTIHFSYWIHLRCKNSCFNRITQSTLKIFNLGSIGVAYCWLYSAYYIDRTIE